MFKQRMGVGPLLPSDAQTKLTVMNSNIPYSLPTCRQSWSWLPPRQSAEERSDKRTRILRHIEFDGQTGMP